MPDSTLQQLVLSLGLGLLVGLQREWGSKGLIGIRSFTLITLFGTLCGLLVEDVGSWVVPAGLVGLAALLVIENRARQQKEERPGPTTELAALVMFTVGATVVFRTHVAVVAAGVTTVLLHWKKPLHAFADRMDEQEIRSIVRFALIALIILPLLPDRSFGPLDVVNPFRVWLMVVLIVGISLVSYLAHRLIGAGVGALVAGALGGLISSTATTFAFAHRSRRGAASTRSSAVIIMTASSVVFVRVLVEVGVVAPEVLAAIAPPVVAMMLWMTLILGVYVGFRRPEAEPPEEPRDPSNLWAAIGFGVVYILVLVGVALAEKHVGESGLYAVSLLSGLTDMDAITLSTAQMVGSFDIDADTGWRMILIGSLSNLVFKGLAVVVLAERPLKRTVAVLFGASLLGGLSILWLWPPISLATGAATGS